MKKYLLAFIFSLFIAQVLLAFDSGKSTTKAMVLSAIIPGGGQFYNESYYKSVGVFAIQGYFIGQTLYHQRELEGYRKDMKSASESDYHYYRAKYNRLYDKRQNDFWWVGTILFLSVVDAFVDASLYNFDEKRDDVHILFNESQLGISISF